MPIVVLISETNLFLVQRRMRELLPAPLTPTSMTWKLMNSFLRLSMFIIIASINQLLLNYQMQTIITHILESFSVFYCVTVQQYSSQYKYCFEDCASWVRVLLYNFITMRSKKAQPKPELQLSFSQQNTRQEQESTRLNIEMLRVHANQKQRILESVWQMNQEQLCHFFSTYRLFPQQLFTMNDLLNTNNLKLIKHDGKIYFGQVERKKKCGIGICVFKEGKIYEGQFQDNERTGCGLEIYSNGNLYIGEFQNNKKHGKGQFFWFSLTHNIKAREVVKNIEHYQGDWWGGLPDGEGIHQKNNGDLYKGTFKNGLKHGVGSQHFGNGDFYKGEYVNGLPEGFGQYEWADGSFYKGDFKQGLRSGYGMWNASNSEFSESYQGHYSMDKKSNYGVYQWENGWIYKGNFENDYRNGYGQLFEGEKCMYRGYWLNGQQTQIESGQQFQHSKSAARTTASIQMSRASGVKGEKNFYETLDTKQFGQPIESRAFIRPDYTIKKRPQSQSTTGKYQHMPSQSKINKKTQNPEREMGKSTKSVEKALFKLNNLYVPGIQSSRVRH